MATTTTDDATHRLRARPGDRLIIYGHHLNEPERDAEILAVGSNGAPPFRIRWSDTGREASLYPGSDARVEHLSNVAKHAGATSADVVVQEFEDTVEISVRGAALRPHAIAAVSAALEISERATP